MKNKGVKLSVILTIMLFCSVVTVTADPSVFETSESKSGINVEKNIVNKLDSVNSKELVANIGDIITFSISVENTGSTVLDVTVEDEMPISFEYLETKEPREPDTALCALNGLIKLIWNFNGLKPESKISIMYNVKITDCGELTNKVFVEGIDKIKESDINSVYCQDQAIVKVGCVPKEDVKPEQADTESKEEPKEDNQETLPDIDIQKYVKTEHQDQFQNEINANIDDNVIFKIYVKNIGNTPLFNIEIIDNLPEETIYAPRLSTANSPEIIDEKTIRWIFDKLDISEELVLIFPVQIKDCGLLENNVQVTANDGYNNEVQKSDNAFVNVECQPIETHSNPENTDTSEDYTLTVNIIGNGTVDIDPYQTNYTKDTEVLLTAIADTNWSFDHWSGNLTGSTNPATIIMDSNKTVTAHFNEITTEEIPPEDQDEEPPEVIPQEDPEEEPTIDDPEEEIVLPEIPDDLFGEEEQEENDESDDVEEENNDERFITDDNYDENGPASSVNLIDDQDSDRSNGDSKKSSSGTQDYTMYLIVGGIILLLLIISMFFLKNDKEPIKSEIKEADPINDNTMCYPNTPKIIDDYISPKDI